MSNYLNDGELIYHTCLTEWIAIYDLRNNIIKRIDASGNPVYDENDVQFTWTAVSTFGRDHKRMERPDLENPSCNGWDECKCDRNGNRVILNELEKKNLPELY